MHAACWQSGIEFDMLFGPAYKGITLAAAVAIELARLGRNVPFAYNRKEAKDHGEGGTLVGAPVRRVLIVDDVISAGTSVRESIALITAAGATAWRSRSTARKGTGRPILGGAVGELGLRSRNCHLSMTCCSIWRKRQPLRVQAAGAAYRDRYGVCCLWMNRSASRFPRPPWLHAGCAAAGAGAASRPAPGIYTCTDDRAAPHVGPADPVAAARRWPACAQQLAGLGVGLALAGLHHLADQRVEGLVLAGAELLDRLGLAAITSSTMASSAPLSFICFRPLASMTASTSWPSPVHSASNTWRARCWTWCRRWMRPISVASCAG
jgi:orotate phosphoribosyltransferase